MSEFATSPINDRGVSEALGLWEPKRTLTLEAARRHTQRIKLLRRGLIIVSALLVLAIIWEFATQQGTIILEDNPEESVKMINPRYSGRTEDNLPFYLTADTATRTLAKRNEVVLDKPVLEFMRESGVESSFVVAESGTYDDVAKILNLRTDVTLDTDDGYRCTTTHARIFAQEKRIEGDEPISCAGNFGNVNGTTYAIEDNYKVFIFKDGMDALIKQDPAASDREAEEGSADDGLFAFGGDGPIDVTAQKATYVGNITDLEGAVEVIQDGATINSDVMKITRRTKDSDAALGSVKLGAIERITATRNFRYQTANNDVRGNQGVYAREKNIITVTGNVTVRQPGGNRVDTDRLTYNVKSDTIRFSGNCQGEGCEAGDRSKIVISGK